MLVMSSRFSFPRNLPGRPSLPPHKKKRTPSPTRTFASPLSSSAPQKSLWEGTSSGPGPSGRVPPHLIGAASPYFFFFFCLFGAAPGASGGSQARGSNPSYSCQPIPQPQQCRIPASSVTYTTANGQRPSLDPLSKARDRTCNLLVPSGLFPLRHNGNSRQSLS